MNPHRSDLWRDWLYTLGIWWDNWPWACVMMALVPVVAAALAWVLYSWGYRDWQKARAAKAKGFDVLPPDKPADYSRANAGGGSVPHSGHLSGVARRS